MNISLLMVAQPMVVLMLSKNSLTEYPIGCQKRMMESIML